MADRLSVPSTLLTLALIACEGSVVSDGGDNGADGGAWTDLGTGAVDGATDSGPGSNQSPVAAFTFTPQSGTAPIEVFFDGSSSFDPDGEVSSYDWDFGGAIAEGLSPSHIYVEAGCHEVSLRVTDNQGGTDTVSSTIALSAGSVESPRVTMQQSPLPLAVIPRDLTLNQGIARFVGSVDSPGAGQVVAVVESGGEVISRTMTPLCGEPPFAFSLDARIPSELRSFDVRLFLERGGGRVQVHEVTDLLAGDILVVQGQSNAVSPTLTSDAGENYSEFVRTFGERTRTGNESERYSGWRSSEVGGAFIGQWPLRMAAQLSLAHSIPIGILNGARGGRQISYYARNDAMPLDLETNYGRLFTRLENAGLTEHVRALLWYQGEGDGHRWEDHQVGFLALLDDWNADFPSVERFYVTQIRTGCERDFIRTQEVQRVLADDFEEISVMSTMALDGHDGCHFEYEQGYRELGDRYAALLSRDLYGQEFESDVDAPNAISAEFALGGTEVVIAMRNASSSLTVQAGAQQDFHLEGSGATVRSVRAEGSTLVLSFEGDASDATGISYLGRAGPGTGQWVTNERGVGLLAFWNLRIALE